MSAKKNQELAAPAPDTNKAQVPLPAEYEQWVAQYKEVHVIEGEDGNGTLRAMYLRKPDKNLKKTLLMTILKTPENLVEIGELFLVGAYIGGYNMLEDEDMSLEAAVTAYEIASKFNDTVMKKKVK